MTQALARAVRQHAAIAFEPPLPSAGRGTSEEIIAKGEITPVFQPIIALSDRGVHGFEALSRLAPGSPLANPEELFQQAVRFGLTSQLELLCRKKALARAHELALPGRLFLNVCPSLLLARDHEKGATAAFLEEIGLVRSAITFELTERTLIEDYGLFKRIISHYRDQGYSIAIDDLGSGYAGLKMLAELEPEYVKLSSFLIRDIDRFPTKQALVEALLTFCVRIGAKVIA